MLVTASGMAASTTGGLIPSLAARGQFDPHQLVAEDRVGDDRVAITRFDRHPGGEVVRDRIARSGGRAADRIARGAGLDQDPVGPIAEGIRTEGIGADEVAVGDGAGRGDAGEVDSRLTIARDHVRRAGGRAADRVPGRPLDGDPIGVLPRAFDPAAVVPIRLPTRRLSPPNWITATGEIAGDDVRGPAGGATDRVARRPREEDTIETVAVMVVPRSVPI